MAVSHPALKLGMKLVGPWLFKKYPYRELYFLEEARRIRAAVQCPLMYIGGCSTVESFETVMNEGFDFVQLGRTLIKDPDLVNHLREQQMGYRNGCNHCNRCAGMIDSPKWRALRFVTKGLLIAGATTMPHGIVVNCYFVETSVTTSLARFEEIANFNQ
jgi:hypothetical protein